MDAFIKNFYPVDLLRKVVSWGIGVSPIIADTALCVATFPRSFPRGLTDPPLPLSLLKKETKQGVVALLLGRCPGRGHGVSSGLDLDDDRTCRDEYVGVEKCRGADGFHLRAVELFPDVLGSLLRND